MAPLPDLGVDWPDLNAADLAAEPAPAAAQPPAPPAKNKAAVDNASNEIRYTVQIDGLEAIGSFEV